MQNARVAFSQTNTNVARSIVEEIESLKIEQTRLSQQCADAQRREKILMRRLANKEQEFQDYVSQIAEYKAAQAPSALALRSALLDPAVNLLFEKLKKELKATKAKLEETQNELSAWKFTPDSNTGKRLMAKCRLLYQENEELGKMTSNGRLAKLETELAMQKSFSEEVKKSQSELDDFLQELDEDVEGMQSTILFLQQELKTTRDRIQVLEKENYQLKNGSADAPKEEALVDAAPQIQHVGLNGNTSANNSPEDLLQLPVAGINTNNTNEMKFQTPPMPLETIDENACMRTTTQLQTIVSDYYNGSDEQTAPISMVVGGNVVDESTVVNSGVNLKLRTAASRKRNYDSDSNENIVATPVAAAVTIVQPVVTTTPRTLPPKKSKLRVTAARRASLQTNELLENERCIQMMGVGVAVGVAAAVDPLSIVDNAVAGMANEETPSSGILIEDPLAETSGGGVGSGVAATGAGVPQRIMTRRRSVRTQQNGGGTGDSNH